ncbi:MAG: hypothetical protein NZ942_02990 [Candidatus Aenigmarchaeota archaeon]|nr:hypothetical protein [Candidatus Aenigmarchaeota archaeon]
MPTITIFLFEKLGSPVEISKALNNKKFKEGWLQAKVSRYDKNEVFIQYFYYENLEDALKKAFSEEDIYEIVSFLKQNGKNKILKRTYCFINTLTKTLEVYRGPDKKTEEIVSVLESLLKVKFSPLRLDSQRLKEIYSKYGIELKQAMFRNIEGLIYEVLRGNCLEKNEKFNLYLTKFPSCLRVISFKPKIKFLSTGKYQVTINGDKGTVKLSSNYFNWRPRFEIRQIIFRIVTSIGALYP